MVYTKRVGSKCETSARREKKGWNASARRWASLRQRAGGEIEGKEGTTARARAAAAANTVQCR